MSSAPTLSLSYRRRGDSTWVDIDPATEQGVRLLHAIGLTEAQHPTEERTMTAALVSTRQVAPLRPVAGTTDQERFAFALRARERAVQMFNAAVAWPRRIARRIVSALHLDKAWALAKDGFEWVKGKMSWIGRMLGTTGMVGTGMVAISTKAGRSVLANTVGRAAGWGLNGLGWGLGVVKGGLRHLGRPGNWAADKIQGAQNWTADKTISGLSKVDEKFGTQLDTGSTTMRTIRLGGVLMVAQRVMTAFGLPLPIVYVIGALTAFWSVYDAADIAIEVGETRGWLKVDEDKKTGSKRATATATATVATPSAKAAKAGNSRH